MGNNFEVGFNRGKGLNNRCFSMYFFNCCLFFQFSKIDFPVNYIKRIKRNAAAAGSVILMIIPLTAFVYIIDKHILKIPLYLYGSLYFDLGVGSVAIYVMGVWYRLTSITKVLKLRLHRKVPRKILLVQETKNCDDVEILRTLTDIYSDLMDACNEINACFGFQLMISFGLIFLFTLFTSFSAYTDIVDEGFLTHVSISSIIFCVYFNFFLSIVIYTCSITEHEVKF